MGSGGIAPTILDLGTRWSYVITPLLHFCSIKTKTPLYPLIGVTIEKCALLSQVCVLEVAARVMRKRKIKIERFVTEINPLNPELNPICYLLALLDHHFLHVSRIRVKSLTIRLLMSYIYIYIWSTHS